MLSTKRGKRKFSIRFWDIQRLFDIVITNIYAQNIYPKAKGPSALIPYSTDFLKTLIAIYITN